MIFLNIFYFWDINLTASFQKFMKIINNLLEVNSWNQWTSCFEFMNFMKRSIGIHAILLKAFWSVDHIWDVRAPWLSSRSLFGTLKVWNWPTFFCFGSTVSILARRSYQEVKGPDWQTLLFVPVHEWFGLFAYHHEEALFTSSISLVATNHETEMPNMFNGKNMWIRFKSFRHKCLYKW